MPSNNRTWLRIGVALGLAWFSIGCNPSTLNFLLMPWVDDRIPPKVKLAKKDEEVTVAVLCTFATLETRPEILPVEGLLADRLTQELRKNSHMNKEKLNFIAPARVKSLVNQNNELSLYEIGHKLKADYVISLEINSISLYEKGSSRQLFRGNADVSVTLVDVSKPRGEGTLLNNETYHREYPGSRGPIEASGSNEIEFRNLFISRMARELSHWFTAAPNEVGRPMD